jgi:hypothetical protein
LEETLGPRAIDGRLDKVLEELGEETGTSIVIDVRVQKQAKSAVRAKFVNSVSIGAALRVPKRASSQKECANLGRKGKICTPRLASVGHTTAAQPSPIGSRRPRMDARALREFLDELKSHGQAEGHFLGLLHILIGRRLARKDGAVISQGLAWREVASWLKKVRWDKDAALALGLKPDELPPRDRERYWYQVIARANVDSPAALQAAEALAAKLHQLGYIVGPAPGKS